MELKMMVVKSDNVKAAGDDCTHVRVCVTF
jgi:hypothetical protein